MERYAVTTFCDDVRVEVGNKISLMGCYGPELLVDSFPAVLPKFCAHVRLFSPIDEPFRTVRFKTFIGDGAEPQIIEVPAAELESGAEQVAKIVERDSAVIQVAAVFVISPFFAPEPMTIRVRIETESGEVKAGAIKIKKNDGARGS